MRVGQARRRDIAEKPIVRDLRKLGYDVTCVSGEGAPDILVRHFVSDPFCWGFECKSRTGKRTKAQQRSNWPIARSLDDVLHEMGDRIRR